MFDNIKKFIKKKKLDKQFKEAGQGYTLEGGGPQRQQIQQQRASGSNASSLSPKSPTRPDVNMLAEAAERRLAQTQSNNKLTPMQRMIREQARKELEEEERKRQGGKQQQQKEGDGDTSGQQEKAKKPSKMLYTCELFGEDAALPKSEMMEYLAQCLGAMFVDDEHKGEMANTAIVMIYTLNKEDVRKPAVETIQKYLQNILDKPEEAKFRRIRMSNKHFQENIAPCKGAVEFLQAVGFIVHHEKQQIDGDIEKFLVMEAVDARNIDKMQKLLAEGKPIAIRVFRDRKVFQIDPQRPISQPEIPDEFFMFTVEELRREQQLRTEALEKMTTLRTAKMREMDEAKEKLPKHKYTYIRVRFPNNFVLQGIFNVFEKFHAVRDFIHKSLAVDYGTFTFNGGIFEDKTLLDLQLVPAALIHFKWDETTMNHFQSAGLPAIPYLSEQLENDADPMP